MGPSKKGENTGNKKQIISDCVAVAWLTHAPEPSAMGTAWYSECQGICARFASVFEAQKKKTIAVNKFEKNQEGQLLSELAGAKAVGWFGVWTSVLWALLSLAFTGITFFDSLIVPRWFHKVLHLLLTLSEARFQAGDGIWSILMSQSCGPLPCIVYESMSHSMDSMDSME